MKYPLVDYPFSKNDINSGRKILSMGKFITMNKVTREFEKRFAKYLGVKYALMVNSGSSANLLSLFALINPKAKKRVKLILLWENLLLQNIFYPSFQLNMNFYQKLLHP